MRSAIFAVALLMAGAAFAQEYPATEPDPAATSTPSLPDAMAGQTDMPVPAGLTVQTNPVVPPTGQVVLPSNADPELDARGIAVISAPAIAPPGFNLAPGTTVAAVGGPLVDASGALVTAPESYPACTATVTDHCLQTYERGRSPS